MSRVQAIFTDGGKCYECIPKKWKNVSHFWVNHNKYFVDKNVNLLRVPREGQEEAKFIQIHSNTIEGKWSYFKNEMRARRGAGNASQDNRY